MQLLLDKGADINSQGGFHGNALQAASYRGFKEVAQLLLDNGADVNTQGGEYANALQAAAAASAPDRECKGLVQLLLDNGADINAQGGYYGNALQAALSQCNEDVVQLLLANGAVPEKEDKVENED